MSAKTFNELEIWKLAISIGKEVYNLSRDNNNAEYKKDFSLRDQVQRSAVSISANIAEGFDRQNNNEFIYFLKIAKGSASETISHLYLMKEIDFVRSSDIEPIIQDLQIVSRRIGSLIKYLNEHRTKP